jgi:hydrogenase maturation protease
VLCLGNDLLADDALGFRVARALRRDLGTRGRASVDIVETPESGFASVVTGQAAPGTVYLIEEDEDWKTTPGTSAHYVGLFDALQAGRAMNLPVAKEVVILAVEAADVVSVGGSMTEAVEAVLPVVVSQVQALLGD